MAKPLKTAAVDLPSAADGLPRITCPRLVAL